MGSLLDKLLAHSSIILDREDFDPEVAETDTLLVPRKGGFTVVFSSRVTLSSQEIRYRIAHEIGHTLFYERGGKDDVPYRHSPPGADEEEFCNRFANMLCGVKDTGSISSSL